MLTLSEKACIDAIEKGLCFTAEIEDGAFTIKIEEYGFFICTAIHNGHRIRPQLQQLCALSDAERLHEEDPYTADIISSMPITLVVNDSRYEYDLNRSEAECVYEEAWGKTVWSRPLHVEEKKRSIEKHRLFYRVLKALVAKIESLHDNCLVYDVHSYNYQRSDSMGDLPVFNTGTRQLDTRRWGPIIDHWVKTLGKCELPNIDVRSSADEVFYGMGHLATFVKAHFDNTLVLPTEVKKVFMDENSGDLYPLVLAELQEAFKQSLLKNALLFSKSHTKKAHSKRSRLLSSTIEPAVMKLDRKLYQLARGIETLLYINPKNLLGEKKRFFARNHNYTPDFTYRQLDINPFEFREQLYRLPIDEISDVTIQQFYRDVIDSFATKIDLIASVGSEKFLYNSLRYYGEPNASDIQTAKFLLFAKPYERSDERIIKADEIKEAFLEAIDGYGIKCKVEVTDKIIASAMVNNVKKIIQINKSTAMNTKELRGLIQHELGVHMVTTVNSEHQKLKVFKLGLPGNTSTQEGLAILSEYLSGNLELPRLQTLALRVLAVEMMVKNYDFSRTFKTLMTDYNLGREEAFKITARVYRGGGYTKDFLYLRGLKDALKLYKERDLTTLFVGKTSFEYHDTINELSERKIVSKPVHLPGFLQKGEPAKPNPILDYLVDTIR